MARKSVRSIIIKPNLRCQRVYPVEGTQRTVEELATVGLKLSNQEAIDLARVLLAATQDWAEIDITAFRFKRRADGTFPITVTSAEGRESKPHLS